MAHRIVLFALALGILSLAPPGCGGHVIIGDGPDSGTTTPSCGAAGGTCVIGPPTNCAKQAPASAQDCNTAMNPGGALCCLQLSGGGAGSAGAGGSGGSGGSAGTGGGGPGPLQTAAKVDLLFDIDNSASMGDKQAYLAKAVPELVGRLVQPNCVATDAKTGLTIIVGRSNNGACTPGTLEFPPVHDMHIGVISSSLGTRGVTGAGAVCDPMSMTNPFNDPGHHRAIPAHDDDRAELINRTATDVYTEGKSADEGGQSFLDWFPTGTGWAVNDGKTPTGGVRRALGPPATPIGAASQLESDFQALVVGAHYYGCGIESQLESWYRFLVQPDPYDSIAIVGGLAVWSGVDATIIKQRHDFLRPDSVVAIVDLTDENDSEIDVRSFGGQGYKFMDESFSPPRGTSECAANPSSPSCTSCAYGGTTAKDPNCKKGPYTAADDPGFYINVRHVHMQQKYGIVPQFPLARYVLGLSSPKVPDRSHEYPAGASSYQGGTVYAGSPPKLKDAYDLNCTNPLFAKSLPDPSDLTPAALCNQSGAGGTRTAADIFYAHIGGVPHQLLQTSPGDGICPPTTPAADCPQRDSLAPTDWVKILGQGWEAPPSPPSAPNPSQYDYTGIDPHMVESFGPRPGLVSLPTGPNPTGGGSDPWNGGEWVTNGASPQHALPVDREYACTFPLIDPVTGSPTPRDCTSIDYSVQEACDCSVTGLPLNGVPAVCGTQSGGPFQAGTNEYTKQYYAKAYPTIRELQLARLLGNQGVISSLCPIHVNDSPSGDDPLFGYRPAVNTLVTRMRGTLIR